jgi:hypothetical protein
VRFKEVGGRGTSPKVLFTIPARIFDKAYSLVFGPDGMLYVRQASGAADPRGSTHSAIYAGRSCGSRAAASLRATTPSAHAPRGSGRAGSRTPSISPSRPTASSRSQARAGRRPTTRSTSSRPVATTAIPTTRVSRGRAESRRRSTTMGLTARRRLGSSTTRAHAIRRSAAASSCARTTAGGCSRFESSHRIPAGC